MIWVPILKIVYPGKSLGYFEEKVVFTDEGLPGEVVEVEPIKIKKNYLEGTTKRILQASAKRRSPRCQHYRVCSPYQIMDYEDQLEIKKEQIKEIFSRQLHLELTRLEVIPSPLIWGYRNRAHFHVIWSEEMPSLAYHQPGSLETFIAVDKCFLIPEKANLVLNEALRLIQAEKLKEIKEIEVRSSFRSDETMLVLFGEDENQLNSLPNSNFLSSKLQKIFNGLPVSAVILILRRKGRQQTQLILGQPLLWEEIQGIRYALGPQSFFQVNVPILDILIKDLKEIIPLSGRERLADLYCGVGTFGLALASRVAEVYGVELMAENVALFNQNLEANRVNNFNLMAGLAAKLADEILSKGMDIVIVDPPRRGLEKRVIRALKNYPSNLLIYLSCNPTTLARDLSQLFPTYQLQSLRFYDFFPQTPHIEMLAILERK